MNQLLLVRHCEAVGQEPDAPLSPRGEDQARALAVKLASEPIDHIVTSPHTRAHQTAAPLAAQFGLPIHTDGRLAEHRLASPPVPDWRDFVARAFVEPGLCAPGGDTPAATLARGLAVVERVVDLDETLPVLVTHGLLLSLILNSIDTTFGFDAWESLRNPEVFRLWGPIDRMRFERIELS